MARLIQLPPKPRQMVLTRQRDVDTLDGIKKIGKKLKNALKGKNLLKTAAVAAAAYGGYKFATSAGGKAMLSKIGSGLSSVGSTVVKHAPQLASSYIAYQTAGQAPEATPAELLPYESGYPLVGPTQEEVYVQPETSVRQPRQASAMPAWVMPAAIGAGLLVVVLAMRK